MEIKRISCQIDKEISYSHFYFRLDYLRTTGTYHVVKWLSLEISLKVNIVERELCNFDYYLSIGVDDYLMFWNSTCKNSIIKVN